jgi:hypothetical protein
MVATASATGGGSPADACLSAIILWYSVMGSSPISSKKKKPKKL